ncbi:membrane alanyl aminopeptidase-like [Drosophila grimshawi]|uniref:membrane alanyl aminopeptidase-like n=1 Tax=Drosophila grimshawi TaxID=7222 RepID=UPI001C936E4E|nr:membrane alanyl aminopeptidase-like [Drosophila grimshawi]
MNSLGPVIWLLAVILSLSVIGGGECSDYRLSRNVLPTFYDLTISLRGDAENPEEIFDGEVKITLHALQANVQQITLHKDNIDILSNAQLYNDAGLIVEDIVNTSMTYKQETQQLTLHLEQPLVAMQSYVLLFKYTGIVRTDMTGLFSASYIEEQTGKTKWMALTQMQRLNARLVFPCFDEPALKAKFQVHIGRPNGLNAISNTKLLETTDDGHNRFVDHFDVTPLMSTYLLAFMISDYKARGNLSDFAVVSRPDYYNKTQFSYQVGQQVMSAFGKLFHQPYPDLGNQALLYASSPRFPHNGMENWGLILYKDAVLVQDPGYTDGWEDQEYCIRILAHETSHMWFGNSVTFKWWSYFWLNEAFARYYEYFMAHQLYPEYQLDEQFVVRQLQMIFATDAIATAQPMTSSEESIQTPSEIGWKFSSIAYAKGASIVRMWHNAMGAEKFENAIGNYLKEHHLGNTEPNDLFAHLKENWAAHETLDLDEFFYDFTEQVGYPMIIVNISQDHQIITLRQKRFLLNPGDGSDADIRYTVPITYTTNLSPNFQNLTPEMYFEKSRDMVNLNFNDPIEWIVLNLRQSNYHRVFYDTELLNRIQGALTKTGHSGIAVENRAAFIDDLFNFASIGSIDYVEVFQFMEYMSIETDYIPWYAAFLGMTRVAKRLTPEQLPNFNKYLSDITDAVYKKLGVSWSSKDKVLDVYNRNKQVAWLCKYQSEDCNNQVWEKFEAESEKPSPDYRETFYCAASRSGGYERVLEFYEKEVDPSTRELLWRAASCTREYGKHYHDKILGNALSVSLKTIGLAQLYEQNPDLVTPIFKMMTEDITQLANSLDSWQKTAQALSDLADYFTTREQQTLFSQFIEESHMLFGSSSDILRKAMTTVDSNLEWAELRLGPLGNYLIERNSAGELAVAATMLLLISTFLSLWAI